jgi:hypothetical protein
VTNFQSLARAVVKWKGLLFGATIFIATHAVIVAKWDIWFGGAHRPWFLNGGNGAVVLTAACLFVASAAGAMCASPDDGLLYGVNVSVGACVAMTCVLFVIGPGPLFPIVIALGCSITGASCLGGWLIVLAFD